MNKQKTSKGFTIIEVVLVLAIAGLIFLMVFIALPTLQKSQRDTQRKSDLSRIETQITSYENSNRSAVPTSLITFPAGGHSFVYNYLGKNSNTVSGSDFQDPSTGQGYTFLAAGTQPSSVGQIGYQSGVVCGTDGAFASSDNGYTAQPKNYAIEIYLEGQAVPYCADNR